MRIELKDTENEKVRSEMSDVIEEVHGADKSDVGGVADEIKKQRKKFSELDFKHKAEYIWDYYKWYIIVAVIVAVFAKTLITDVVDNLRPTYLNVEMINTYFGNDPSNTLATDYVSQYNIDLETYHLNIMTDINLATEAQDAMMVTSQQKLMAMYAAQEVDVVMGPVDIMEGPANCDCYADFSQILPQDLIDELKDREYEFYYFDPSDDQVEDYEGESVEPYFAGVYLDNCSYLNNNGERGAFPVATSEGDRPIYTIAANTKNVEHAIEFLRFLIENR